MREARALTSLNEIGRGAAQSNVRLVPAACQHAFALHFALRVQLMRGIIWLLTFGYGKAAGAILPTAQLLL